MEITELFSIVNTLRPWLLQRPAKAEVLEYAKRLSDEQTAKLQEATVVLLREFYQDLRQYMKEYGWGELFDTRQINDQFVTFSDLTQYNATSVAKNLAQVMTFAQQPQSPPELPKAVGGFLAVWYATVSLKAAPYYFDNSLLIDSILGTSLTSEEQFQKIKTDTIALFARDEEHAATGKPFTPGEVDEDRKHFQSFGFLPDDFAKALAEDQLGFERAVILQRIIRIFSIIEVVGFAQAKANPELVKERLWEVLRLGEEDAVMVTLEAERLLENEPDTELQAEAAFLLQVWTAENILSRVAAQKTLEHIAGFTLEAKQAYRKVFGDMMVINPFITLTLGDESARAVIAVLDEVRDLTIIRRMIEQLKEELILEDLIQHAEIIVEELSAVYQSLPVMGEIPRYSRAATGQ